MISNNTGPKWFDLITRAMTLKCDYNLPDECEAYVHVGHPNDVLSSKIYPLHCLWTASGEILYSHIILSCEGLQESRAKSRLNHTALVKEFLDDLQRIKYSENVLFELQVWRVS